MNEVEYHDHAEASAEADYVSNLELERDELLNALSALLRVCDEELDPKRTPEMAIALAAIAKAEGAA